MAVYVVRSDIKIFYLYLLFGKQTTFLFPLQIVKIRLPSSAYIKHL